MQRSRTLMVVAALGVAAVGAYVFASQSGQTVAVSEFDPNKNSDGDCMTDAEEAVAGTDPMSADGDGDGISDCDEVACGSNPSDAKEKCYACGWKRNDPRNLVSDGAEIGNVVSNIQLPDQCGEQVSLWDFHGQYFIMYMTAAW